MKTPTVGKHVHVIRLPRFVDFSHPSMVHRPAAISDVAAQTRTPFQQLLSSRFLRNNCRSVCSRWVPFIVSLYTIYVFRKQGKNAQKRTSMINTKKKNQKNHSVCLHTSTEQRCFCRAKFNTLHHCIAFCIVFPMRLNNYYFTAVVHYAFRFFFFPPVSLAYLCTYMYFLGFVVDCEMLSFAAVVQRVKNINIIILHCAVTCVRHSCKYRDNSVML